MKDKRLIWFLILISQFTFSQIKGVVVDESNNPIPFVNIWVEDENISTTSEEDGSFSLDVELKQKKLFFSCLGYKTYETTYFKGGKVVLLKETIQLKEVIIDQKHTTKTKDIDYYQTYGFRWHLNHFSNSIFIRVSEEDRQKFPYLINLKFRTISRIDNAKIRVYFVEKDSNGAPSNKLVGKEIIIGVKKGNRKNEIDFKSLRIEIPEEGFFVVIEKLKIEQNKYSQTYKIPDKSGKVKTVNSLSYEPNVALIPSDEDIAWYKEKGDRWFKNHKQTLEKPNNFENILMKKYHDKYLIPSIKVTLSN